MRIEAYTQVQQVYNTRKAAKAETAKRTHFADQVQISSMGKDIQAAKQAVNAAADIREDVTAPIKSAIDNGTYSVDEESFAEKLYNKYYNEMR